MPGHDADRENAWRPAAEAPGHPVARWQGATVGEDVRLDVEVGPRNAVGASYFRLYLLADQFGRLKEPVIFGMQSHGPHPGFNWVEVLAYRDRLTREDGDALSIPLGVERLIFRRLAELVPPGGHLMAEYDSSARALTARALVAGVPPRATPLGATLAAAGCGVAFRDWYFPEGGREGPRKLQGFRAIDEEHARLRDGQTLAELEAFMDASAHLEWNVQARTRTVAQEAIYELRQRRATAVATEPGGSTSAPAAERQSARPPD